MVNAIRYSVGGRIVYANNISYKNQNLLSFLGKYEGQPGGIGKPLSNF
jgi:hypothetical protein